MVAWFAKLLGPWIMIHQREDLSGPNRRAMPKACESDSRCGSACDASTRDAKSLAMWVERCEPLRVRFGRTPKGSYGNTAF